MMRQVIVGPYQEYPGQVLTKPSIAPVSLDEFGNDRNEWWEPIEGYPEYWVSTRGRIASTLSGWKILKQSNNKATGYLQVNLHRGGVNKTFRVHKLVARAFKGPAPEGFEVDHIDGNKHNCDAGNLQFISKLDNIRKSANKRIVCYKPDGSERQEFNSITEASIITGISLGGIGNTLTKRAKTSGGFLWEYLD